MYPNSIYLGLAVLQIYIGPKVYTIWVHGPLNPRTLRRTLKGTRTLRVRAYAWFRGRLKVPVCRLSAYEILGVPYHSIIYLKTLFWLKGEDLLMVGRLVRCFT